MWCSIALADSMYALLVVTLELTWGCYKIKRAQFSTFVIVVGKNTQLMGNLRGGSSAMKSESDIDGSQLALNRGNCGFRKWHT